MALPKPKVDWYVTDAAGVSHLPRESDGVHHLTVCGKYVRAEALPYNPARHPNPCFRCRARMDPGFIVERADPEPVPQALSRGRGWSYKGALKPKDVRGGNH